VWERRRAHRLLRLDHPLQEIQARRERKLALEDPELPGAAAQASSRPSPVRPDAPPLSPGAVTALAEIANDEPARCYPGSYPASPGRGPGIGF
jgi:hypothetical protein